MATREATRASQVLADLRDELFADVPQVADVLRIDQRTVRRSIEDGTIPGIRTGARWRVPTLWLRQAAGLESSEAGS